MKMQGTFFTYTFFSFRCLEIMLSQLSGTGFFLPPF